MAKGKKSKVLVNKQQAARIINLFKQYIEEKSTLFTVYSNWYSGVSKHPETRKKQHQKQKNIPAKHFKCYETDNVETSVYIEKQMRKLGLLCKDGGNYGKTSKNVYIFKLTKFF